MAKFETTPDGRLASSPIGAHVTLTHDGRCLLGEVTAIQMLDIDGERMRCLTVRHFNGEPWPVMPYFMEVDVLEREWEP